MAPGRPAQNYEVGEKVLCFHGPVMYEAKILDTGHEVEGDKKSAFIYYVHYQGWKSSWDDWVTDDRVRKASSDNREIMKQQHQSQKQKQRADVESKKSAKKMSQSGSNSASRRKSHAAGSDNMSSTRGMSEDRGSNAHTPNPLQPSRGTKRNRDELEKEEVFYSKPAIRIPVPDSLKRLLVDDWEFITKDMALVPIPHKHPITDILNDYLAYEGPRRRPDSAEADVLDEIVQGVREYFDKALGRILLYRFERQQWADISSAMNKDPSDPAAIRTTTITSINGEPDQEWRTNIAGKVPSEVYGAEHLARLFVNLPELIAQTNMDQQSVNRLKEELGMLGKWLGKHAKNYFTPGYNVSDEVYKIKVKGLE